MRLVIAMLILVSPAFAGEKICVKNELSSGMNVCEAFPKDFTYLVNVDPDAMFEACARTKSANFCEMAPDSFVWVISKLKQRVCVQRFDTSVSDLCTSHPKSYSWIWVDGASD